MRLFLLLILSVYVNLAFTQTNVTGIISSNAIWSPSGSPYKIIGNTQINAGVTLTIQPGTVITAQGNYFVKVLGNIVAQGTITDSIIFNSQNNAMWAGLQLISSGSTLNTDYTFSSGSVFTYCSFYSSSRALFAYNTGIYVSNCSFTNNTIALEPRKTVRSLIGNSSFKSNGTGIYSEYEDYVSGNNVGCIVKLKIDKNNFDKNTTGINLLTNQTTFDSLIVSNSLFTNNVTGFILGGGGYGPYLANVEIKNNTFYKDTVGLYISTIYSNGYNGCTGNLGNSLKIQRNNITNNATGLKISNSGSGHLIENNVVSNNRIGIVVEGVSNSITFNKNTITDNNKSIQMNSTMPYYNPTNISFTNNLISNPSTNSADYVISHIQPTNNNNKFRKNNFINCAPILIKNTGTGNLVFDSNYVVLPAGMTTLRQNIIDIYTDVAYGEVLITNDQSTSIASAPLNIPRNAAKVQSGNNVILTWSAGAGTGINGYKVYYSNYNGYAFSNAVNANNVLSYTLPNTNVSETFGITQYTSLTGTDDQLIGNESNYSFANKIPDAPINLISTKIGNAVKLTWSMSNVLGIDKYNIYRSANNVSFSKIGSVGSLTYTDNSVAANATYFYKVSAFDSLNANYDNFGLEGPLSTATNITLPLSLLSLNGKESNGQAYINWQTSAEINSSKFIIEHSVNGTDFLTVGNLAAAGNGNSIMNYSFIHVNPSKGINYYRLKIIDIDEKFSYSKVIVITLNNKNGFWTIFPNPIVTNSFTIDAGMEISMPMAYNIYNLSGKLIKQGIIVRNRQTITINKFQSGIYFLKLNNGQTIKLIKAN